FKQRNHGPATAFRLDRSRLPLVVAAAFGTGLASGFFGIGGGFLIVPALMFSTGMPIRLAIGTSLVAVTAFGLTTAANYAASGLVDVTGALALIVGGCVGSVIGARIAQFLSRKPGALNILFSTVVFSVAVYTLTRSLQ